MIAALLVVTGTFVATVPWGGHLVSWLRSRGIGKQIRRDGPSGHEVKRGTPTMGGILFLVPVLLLGGVLALREPRLWGPLGVTAVFALFGAVDDLRGLRDAEGYGWLARYKFPWQVGLGLLGGVMLYLAGAPRSAAVPFVGLTIDLGLGYIPAAALVIVSAANGVNFNDGLDGLAGGTTALAFAAYGLIALASPQLDLPLSLLAAVYVGAILAFLWYNVHPAHLFMGDLGSMGLGAGLASVALMTEHWLLLPLIGAVFVAEVASVIMQVGYYKATKGRRILRMAPLHCHFEMLGWPKTRIVVNSWLLGALLALAGVLLAVMR